MTNEDINKLELNLDQSKKLIKYINYFKTLKDEELKITKESTKEEVAKFLKNDL